MIEPPRILLDHELVFVSEGFCSMEIGERSFALGRGSFAIVPPLVRHSTVSGPGGVTRRCAHFDWLPGQPPLASLPWIFLPASSTPPRRETASGFPGEPLTGRCEDVAGVSALFDSLLELDSKGDPLSLRLCAPRLHELLLTLLSSDDEAVRRPLSRGSAERLAYEMREILDASFKDRVPLSELLSLRGYSYEHLCRVFSASFGLSPTAYLLAVRIERAKALLRSPSFRTVAETAYELGFEDPGYFARVFKRHAGITPGAYASAVRVSSRGGLEAGLRLD